MMEQIPGPSTPPLARSCAAAGSPLAGALPDGWPTDIPLARIRSCGLLAVEVLREVRSDKEGECTLVYAEPEEGRQSASALNLLKLLVSQPWRMAAKDWLVENLPRLRTTKEEWGERRRFDNVVSLLRGLLCPPGMPGEDHLRKILLAQIPETSESGTGYRLARFPLIWLDVEAMAAHVRQAQEHEADGLSAFSSWHAAYEIGQRGPFLADAIYSDWAIAKRGEIEGLLWQSVQGLGRSYDARQSAEGEEQALLLLQGYWLGHRDNEEAFLSLLSILCRREEGQLAQHYYTMLCTALEQEERHPMQPIERAIAALRQGACRSKGGYGIRAPSSLGAVGGSPSTLPPSREALPGSSLPRLWNVPYPRNPYFTGREDVLTRLRALLTSKQVVVAVAPHALCGLGGVGKTQAVLEYVFRYASDYRAVFWIRADTRENLLTDFGAIAQLLGLPERDAQDQAVTSAAIGRWLHEHVGWLLVFDNADDLEMVGEVLPTGGQGHVLLTTRTQAMGRVAHRLEVEEMSLETGALFLLRRAGLLPPDVPLDQAAEPDRVLAEEIVRDMGGLPLALDQAGAYIEETASSLRDWVELYQANRQELLRRRGGLLEDHPESVATTWHLSLTRLENGDPLAASLLHLCAFLAPDGIPEDLLLAGAHSLVGQPREVSRLRFLDALGSLLRLSLVRRHADTHTITVHRLIQSVVRDTLAPEQHAAWIQQAVALLAENFPSAIEVTTWPRCETLLPHALLCAQWTERADVPSLQVASLLDTVGHYLNLRARYDLARPLLQRALLYREQALGEQYPATAQTLSNLAYLHHHQDQFEEAMLFLQRSLTIRQQVLGMEHHETATSLNALGLLYRDQGRYAEAEPWLQWALRIRMGIFGPGHPQTAHSLSNLAWLYRNQGNYRQAEGLYEQALAIRECTLGEEHPETAASLNGLALLYAAQKEHAKAKALFLRALTIRQRVLGTQHLHTTQSMNALALLYCEQGAYEEAERLFEEVVAIREHLFGSDHPRTRAIAHNLERCQRERKK